MINIAKRARLNVVVASPILTCLQTQTSLLLQQSFIKSSDIQFLTNLDVLNTLVKFIALLDVFLIIFGGKSRHFKVNLHNVVSMTCYTHSVCAQHGIYMKFNNLDHKQIM